MSEFESRQAFVDDITTKSINGEVSKETAIKAQEEFEKWKAETTIDEMKIFD